MTIPRTNTTATMAYIARFEYFMTNQSLNVQAA